MKYSHYHYLLDCFVEAGVKHIFTYPGHGVIGLLDLINGKYANKIQLIVSSSEQEAVCAADVYARYNGLGAVIVTFGVGSLSGANFITNSHVSRSPLIIISGRPTQKESKGLLIPSLDDNIDAYVNAFKSLGLNSLMYKEDTLFGDLLNQVQKDSEPLFMEIAPDIGAMEVKEKRPLPEKQEPVTDVDSCRFTHWLTKKMTDTSLEGPLELSHHWKNGDFKNITVVYDVGESMFAASQIASYLKEKDKALISPLPWASMGFALPASIGAAFSRGLKLKESVLAIAGDGSFRLTMLSLSTIARYQLNIKILLIDNNGFETEKLLSDDAVDANYNKLSPIDYLALIKSFGLPLCNDLDSIMTINGPAVLILKKDQASAQMKVFCKGYIRSSIE